MEFFQLFFLTPHARSLVLMVPLLAAECLLFLLLQALCPSDPITYNSVKFTWLPLSQKQEELKRVNSKQHIKLHAP